MKSLQIAQSALLAAALAFGVSGSAFAQTATAAPAAAGTGSSLDPSYGMLGSRYVGIDYGYLRFDEPNGPRSGHEFGVDYNQPLTAGLDFTAAYSDASTGYFGTRPRTDQILAGLTAYQPVNSWLRPFLSGQAGVALVRDDELFSTSGLFGEHNSTDYFDFVLAAGAEVQLTHALVATPFASYQEIHTVDHDWDYGVKVSYRLAPSWSVSFTPSIDQHRNLGYEAGVNFHF